MYYVYKTMLSNVYIKIHLYVDYVPVCAYTHVCICVDMYLYVYTVYTCMHIYIYNTYMNKCVYIFMG